MHTEKLERMRRNAQSAKKCRQKKKQHTLAVANENARLRCENEWLRALVADLQNRDLGSVRLCHVDDGRPQSALLAWVDSVIP